MRPEAEPWWRQAEADLHTGRGVLTLSNFYAVSWFAQQAAEKGLKALYIDQRGVLAPRTHDLIFLGNEVGVPAAVDADVAHLATVFDEVRYPDSTSGRAPVDEVTAVEAASDLAAAERVLQWIRAQLGR